MPEPSEPQVMGQWAYATMIVAVAFAAVLLILGLFFLVDVAIRGWPR